MAANETWNKRPANENENLEKLTPMANHKINNKANGAKHNAVNTVDTTTGGVDSGNRNVCLISGNGEYNFDLSSRPLVVCSSVNDNLISANLCVTGVSNNESDTIKSTL